MSEQKYIKYGDRTMALEPGMTLDQAKELMARHFPELADPKIDTKKDGDKVTYVFSKKAGHKGARASRPNAKAIRKLLQLQASYIVTPRDVADYDESITPAIQATGKAVAQRQPSETRRVEEIRQAMLELPSAIKPTGSVL